MRGSANRLRQAVAKLDLMLGELSPRLITESGEDGENP